MNPSPLRCGLLLLFLCHPCAPVLHVSKRDGKSWVSLPLTDTLSYLQKFKQTTRVFRTRSSFFFKSTSKANKTLPLKACVISQKEYFFFLIQNQLCGQLRPLSLFSFPALTVWLPSSVRVIRLCSSGLNLRVCVLSPSARWREERTKEELWRFHQQVEEEEEEEAGVWGWESMRGRDLEIWVAVKEPMESIGFLNGLFWFSCASFR